MKDGSWVSQPDARDEGKGKVRTKRKDAESSPPLSRAVCLPYNNPVPHEEKLN